LELIFALVLLKIYWEDEKFTSNIAERNPTAGAFEALAKSSGFRYNRKMEQIISKEEFNELMSIEGETKGMAFKADFEYVISKKGDEGLKKLEDTLEKLGYPLKYKELKVTKFYPSGLEPLLMVVCQRLFGYTDEDFWQLGVLSATMPWVVRIFIKYFGSLEMIVRGASAMWRKYYTKGKLKVVRVDKKKKFIILRIENFSLHPFYCKGMEGYFATIVRMVVTGNPSCQELKCVHRGDEYHEFLVKW